MVIHLLTFDFKTIFHFHQLVKMLIYSQDLPINTIKIYFMVKRNVEVTKKMHVYKTINYEDNLLN